MKTTIEATLADTDGRRGWLVWDCYCHWVIEFDSWAEAVEHATRNAADAWRQGYNAALGDTAFGIETQTPNPYDEPAPTTKERP